MAALAETPLLHLPQGFQHQDLPEVSVMPRCHRHQEVEVNFIARGAVTYLINGALTTVPAGTLAVFWATVPHQLVRVARGSGGFCWFHFPLAWLLQWGMPPGLLGPLLEGRLILDPAPSAADPARVREWVAMLARPPAGAWEKVVLLEIQARLHRIGLHEPGLNRTGQAPPRRRNVHAGNLLKVEEIARYLAEHYREPLTVADVARRVRLHPTHTMNLFRRHSGQTVLECVTQHRVAHAQRRLVTTTDKVLDVALDSGFGSLSRFYEAFTAACGTTPRRYRKGFATP